MPDRPEGPRAAETLRAIQTDRAIAEGRKHYALTVGELFPDGDLAAQWVFSLTALVEDVQALMDPLRRAREAGDLRGMLFFYRQLVTRLYEARRLAATARTEPEIASFVGDLLRRPPGGVDLEQAYLPDLESNASRVDTLYAELRHRTVHYMEPGGRELADSLWRHSGYPAQLEIGEDERRRPTLWFKWVHAVTAADVFGDATAPDMLKTMRERDDLLSGIATSWTSVAAVAVPLHLRRLGIDAERVGVKNGAPNRSQTSSAGREHDGAPGAVG